MTNLLSAKKKKQKQPCHSSEDTKKKPLLAGKSGTVGPGWLLALSMDMEIICVYEACTKFPIGGMYATLAQAL